MTPVTSPASSVRSNAAMSSIVATSTSPQNLHTAQTELSASVGHPHGSAARNTSVQSKAVEEFRYSDFTKEFDSSKAYDTVFDSLATRFPDFQEAARNFPSFSEYAKGFPNIEKIDKGKLSSLSYLDGKPPIGAILARMDGPVLEKSDLRPGDILITYEPVNNGDGGQNEKVGQFRVMTLQKQADNHNGIPANRNQGDYRAVHGFIWTGSHDPKEGPAATEQWGHGVPELVEARAARNLEVPINRVQPAAANEVEHGYCKVYRPQDKFATAIAQTALSMANGHIHYTMKELRSSMKTDGESCSLSQKGKIKIVDMAEDAFKPVLEWAVNPENIHEDYKEGVICSTFVVKAAQIAEVKRLQAELVEHAIEQQPKGPNSEVKMPCVDTLELVNKLTGLFALDAANVSVRTLEHFLLQGTDDEGKPQCQFVGKFGMAGKKPLFAEITPPMPTAQSTRLASTDSRTVENVELAKAKLKSSTEQEHVFQTKEASQLPDSKK